MFSPRICHNMLVITVRSLLYCASTFLLAFSFAVFKVLRYLPLMEGPITKMFLMVASIDMQKREFWSGLFSWEMFKQCSEMVFLDIMHDARPGKPSPNPSLVSQDGRKRHRLLDFVRGSRPLVVNIGSCTCPVFMARAREFNRIVDEFSRVADFVTIYIKEAHSSNEWRLEGNIDINQPQTLQERCNAAQNLVNLEKLHPKSTLLVDTMDNGANKAFGGLPIRLYVIQDGRIQFGSAIGPTFYRTEEVRKWLHDHRLKSNRQRA